MSALQNEKGQYVFYGKAGGCLVTGNEDGIKHCAMGILYALQHIGYSIPPQADAGWIGEAGQVPVMETKVKTDVLGSITNSPTETPPS